GMTVGQNSLLARGALALAIAPIVKGENRDALAIAQLEQVGAHRAQAFAVPMAVEHYGSRLGMLDEPAGQPRTIRRQELPLFVRQIGGAPVALWILRSGIEQCVFQVEQQADECTISAGRGGQGDDAEAAESRSGQRDHGPLYLAGKKVVAIHSRADSPVCQG